MRPDGVRKFWRDLVKRCWIDDAAHLWGPDFRDDDTPKPSDVLPQQVSRGRLTEVVFMKNNGDVCHGWLVRAQSEGAAAGLLEAVDCAHISPREYV